MRTEAGEPFVRALRHMIDLYTSRPVNPDEDPTVLPRSGDLAATLPNLKPWFVEVLPDMLSVEPLIRTSGANFNGEGKGTSPAPCCSTAVWTPGGVRRKDERGRHRGSCRVSPRPCHG